MAHYHWCRSSVSPFLLDMDRMNRPRLSAEFEVMKDAGGMVLDDLNQYLIDHSSDHADILIGGSPVRFGGGGFPLYIGTLPDPKESDKSHAALLEMEGQAPDYDFGSENIRREHLKIMAIARGQRIEDGGYQDARKVIQVIYLTLGSIWNVELGS